MTPESYRAALSTLGLSQLAAGRWLNVSPKTAQNYASKGPSGPAAVAIRMALAIKDISRFDLNWTSGSMGLDPCGEYVKYYDLRAVADIDLHGPEDD